MIPGIPTTYQGTRFRSRLEARWAAMFDLLAWSWEYEPLDLAGYIPDFVLKFERPLLVEVKPITATDHTDVDVVKIAAAFRGQPSAEVVTLGAVLHEYSNRVQTGWRWYQNADEMGLEPVDISWYRDHWTLDFDEPGCRAGGCRPSDHPCVHRGIHFDDRVRLIQLWREAGNRVQWRSR